MQGKGPSLAPGLRRAALAFSVLPTPDADSISHLLNMRERVRLREGLSQVRDAPDHERIAALHSLVRAIRVGLDWPVLAAHNAGARSQVLSQLHEVSLVGTVRPRILAREAAARLSRAAKIAATRPFG